jgi:hypothetical protein
VSSLYSGYRHSLILDTSQWLVYELCARWFHKLTENYNEFDKLELDGSNLPLFWSSLVRYIYKGYRETIGVRVMANTAEFWPTIKALDR